MLLQALLMSTLLTGPANLDDSVTFSCSGLDAPHLIKQLGEAAHVPLYAPAGFSADVLILRVKNAPLKDVMDRIADLTAGEWKPKSGGYELLRSPVKARAEAQAELDSEVASYAKAIEAEQSNLAKLEKWNDATARTIALGFEETQKAVTSEQPGADAWRRIQALDARAPGGRALTRLMASLDPAILANLPVQVKVVFSSDPNRLQRPLTPGMRAALKDLVAEQNLWSDVSSQEVTDSNNVNYGSWAMGSRQRFGTRPGKVLVGLCRTSNVGRSSVNVSLSVRDEKGNHIVEGNRALSGRQTWAPGKAPTPQPGEKPIPSSPLADALRDAFMSSSSDGSRKPFPPVIINLLTHPEQYEPMSLSTGPILISIAEDRNENLIAELNDELFMIGAYAAQMKLTPSMLFASASQLSTSFLEGNGWIVLRSDAPATARRMHADRALLGQYLRAVTSKGYATLDEMAAYATATEGDIYNSIGFALAMVLSPGVGGDDYVDMNMLRLYGLLGQSQKQALLSPQGMSLALLTDRQRDSLDRMIFGMVSRLNSQRPPSMLGSAEFQMETEPTEILADGFPQDSNLTMVDRSESVIFMAGYEMRPGVRRGGQVMTPSLIAMFLLAKERPGVLPGMEGGPPIEEQRFHEGSQRQLRFNFRFGDAASIQSDLRDKRLDPKPLKYAELPQAFRDEVLKQLERVRKDYANIKPGQIGSPVRVGSPPPPAR